MRCARRAMRRIPNNPILPALMKNGQRHGWDSGGEGGSQ